MDFSTLMILTIAVLIIIYRVKTWNDDTVEPDNASDSDKPAETATAKTSKETPAAPKKTVSAQPTKEKKVVKSSALYTKQLNGSVVKNQILVQALDLGSVEGQAVSFKGEPKRGITTHVIATEVDEERVMGVIVEVEKEVVRLLKSFDVKLTAAKSFKVPTTFSKSQSIKLSDAVPLRLTLTDYVGHDGECYAIDDVSLTLK